MDNIQEKETEKQTEKEEYNEYMAIVYQNPSMEIREKDNYKFVVAANDIKFGELLLVEHVYASSASNCHSIIENNEFLFNMYHPRLTNFAETENKFPHAKEKLVHNCFGLANDDKLITYAITKMNHSCDPNCAVYIQEKYNIGNTNTIFMELYAVRPIKSGTELTICYGPETAHNRDFECNCGKDLPQRKKIFDVVSSVAKALSHSNNSTIREKIYHYLETPISKKIQLNQYLSTKGIIFNKNTISGYTVDGLDLINNLVHKYLGVKGDINSADGTIKEVPMNDAKIAIFLKLLNENLLSF